MVLWPFCGYVTGSVVARRLLEAIQLGVERMGVSLMWPSCALVTQHGVIAIFYSSLLPMPHAGTRRHSTPCSG
ncbi:hypothetical protein BD410DRAFT_361189 [Rickenella mellea]|uniref:Uncharacterized protein n=1 Tax=Rickenella mellea TaxID=50990 RepID=A0A4Y7PEQ9_9AGAM|nr:hypothetical protein BD410DRAFT_361189 [Rickenella mellea]